MKNKIGKWKIDKIFDFQVACLEDNNLMSFAIKKFEKGFFNLTNQESLTFSVFQGEFSMKNKKKNRNGIEKNM